MPCAAFELGRELQGQGEWGQPLGKAAWKWPPRLKNEDEAAGRIRPGLLVLKLRLQLEVNVVSAGGLNITFLLGSLRRPGKVVGAFKRTASLMPVGCGNNSRMGGEENMELLGLKAPP